MKKLCLVVIGLPLIVIYGCSTVDVKDVCNDVALKLRIGTSIVENERVLAQSLDLNDARLWWGGELTTNTVYYRYGDSLAILLYTKTVLNSSCYFPNEGVSEANSRKNYFEESIIGFMIEKYLMDSVVCQYVEGTYHPRSMFSTDP